LKKLGIANRLKWFLRHYDGNEDLFWGRQAVHFDSSFRVPTTGQALRFSFETDPAFCFERNARQLPFGCHGWARYDRKFWEPYLLP
jgi:hypothetical protein